MFEPKPKSELLYSYAKFIVCTFFGVAITMLVMTMLDIIFQ